jgi:hypothetical protein
LGEEITAVTGSARIRPTASVTEITSFEIVLLKRNRLKRISRASTSVFIFKYMLRLWLIVLQSFIFFDMEESG